MLASNVGSRYMTKGLSLLCLLLVVRRGRQDSPIFRQVKSIPFGVQGHSSLYGS